MSTPLSAAIIHAALETVEAGPFGARFEYHPRIGSTNDRLHELAAGGAAHGTLVITDEQITGRGRMGRTWVAPPNTALLMSLLFRPQLDAAHLTRLVMVCGLALMDAAPELHLVVKWPNDIQAGGKKVAGILPEGSFTGDQLDYVIVGMGVNVNQRFPPGDPLAEKATSLQAVNGEPLERPALLARTLAGIRRWYGALHDHLLLAAWRERCVTLGQRVQVQVGDTVLTGRAETINDSGALVLAAEDGSRRAVTLSEATVLG